MDISTGTTTNPRLGGGQNSETYWVGGNNISPITRTNSIQNWRSNDFHIASIIAKNCMEGLPDETNISLDDFKSKITLISWIAWIRSYMEDNIMEAIFFVYNQDLKT